jgi:hypothetical protein
MNFKLCDVPEAGFAPLFSTELEGFYQHGPFGQNWLSLYFNIIFVRPFKYLLWNISSFFQIKKDMCYVVFLCDTKFELVPDV